MKKTIVFQALILTSLTIPEIASAQTTGGVGQIQTFIQSIIQTLTTLAGLVSVGFFIWGGFGYITSSGNPEALDRSKKTILYSAIGLAIVLGAFVLSHVVAQLAGSAFGSSTGY